MEKYIEKQLVAVNDLLETGISINNLEMVKKTVPAYKTLKKMVTGNDEYEFIVKESAIRACTFLCSMDIPNAIEYLDEASKYDENNPVILNNYGLIFHTRFANFDKSIQYYERCLSADPKYITAYLGLIDVYRSLRLYNTELEYSMKAIKNCPESSDLWNCVGLARMHVGKYSNISMIQSPFKKALELTFSKNKENGKIVRAKVLVNIGHVYGSLGNYSKAVDYYLEAVENDPEHATSYQNILMNLHYFSNKNEETFKKLLKTFEIEESGNSMKVLINEIHTVFVDKIYRKTIETSVQTKLTDTDRNRKIRIGFLTYDLIDHAVSFFSNAIFRNYSESNFEIYIYSNNIYNEKDVHDIRNTGFRYIQKVPASICAEQIKNDKIDVLIDISGHTSGNRLDIIALKPAAIILSYLGYPCDIGFSFVKRISDVYTEKYNETNSVHLDRLFLCYTPKNLYTDFVKFYPKQDKKNKKIVFGCFAKLQKINQEVINVWKQILEKVPNSRFILKSRYFADYEIVDEWKQKFQPYDKRVSFMCGTEKAEEHMKMYKLLDVHLDTFPYSGTTISTESLFMNVPVITYAPIDKDSRHVERVTGSILNSMSFKEDLIACTKKEYVEKAVALTTKLHWFPSVRKRFLETEISNDKDFILKFEKLVSDLYVEKCWEEDSLTH